MTTVIHINSKMWFIDYTADDTTISTCSWMDESLVAMFDLIGSWATVGPLWACNTWVTAMFTTWASPKWRSSCEMGADGAHWSMILDIPGEGFRDDALQHYSKHCLPRSRLSLLNSAQCALARFTRSSRRK